MSIRLRLTLLYSAILALTLIVFGLALYMIQSQYTLEALKRDLTRSGERLGGAVLWAYQRPVLPGDQETQPPPPRTFEVFTGDPAFQGLREREIVRVLDDSGTLIASPLSGEQESLPLSAQGIQALQSQEEWWQTGIVNDEHVLIYNRPVISNGEVIFIIQAARQLTERDRSLAALATTLVIASLVTVLIAFGIGWVLSGAALRPIHRITQTAQAIGNESDFSRRVEYSGPNDEIGQLAKTFNSMLVRLQNAYQQVAQSLEMQRNFVADVSHELRTPLTTLRGNLDLLRRKPALPDEEQDDILSDMVEENDRLIRLITDLLILARADAGRNRVKEPLDLMPVLEEVYKQARQLDVQRQITLDTTSPLMVLGDRDAVKQVILILLDNAIKHSVGEIVLSAQMQGSYGVISVRDSGPGIPPEKLEHVFDRFFRGEDSPQTPGFGLGLPIAKALTEAIGGQIEIESSVGRGSVVRVRLPGC